MVDRLRRFASVSKDELKPAVNRRDETEFVRLLEKHERHVYAFILSFVPSWTDADEILQETYLRLYEKIDEWDPGRSFLPWACTVARYQVLTYRKRSRREQKRFRHQIVDRIAACHDAESDRLELRTAALRQCLTKLSQSEQTLLDLAYRQDLSIDQLAEQSRRTVAAAYKALQRIRKTLHDCIERTMQLLDHP